MELEYTLFFLFALGIVAKAAPLYPKTYPTGTVAVNKGVLYDLGNGFHGRYSSIHSKLTGTGMDVASALWFINATNEEYHLCLLEFGNSAQIVWCANNGGIIHRPVSTGAALTFQADGNLVLKDTQGISVFETGTAGRGVSYLGIDIDINLRLFKDDYTVVWKSHKYPLNTLVIAQSFTTKMRLTSWSSSTNSSQGPYTMVME